MLHTPHAPRTRFRLLGSFALFLGLLALAIPANAATGDDDQTLKLSPTTVTLDAGSSIEFSIFATNPDTGETWDASRAAQVTTTDPTGNLSGPVYTAGSLGSWKVRATLNNASVSTTVTVRPGPVDHIVVNPNSLPEIVGRGERRQFEAKAYDRMNNLLTNLVVSWKLEGSIGTVSATGLFTANRDGEGRIIAQSGSVTGSADVRVRAAAVDAPLPSLANTTAVNSNANANTNSGDVLGTDTEVLPTSTNETTKSCWDIRWWGWLIVLIGSLLILYGYYKLIETKTDLWIWIVPLLLASGLFVLYFLARCDSVAGWFPWIVVVGFLILTLFRPYRFVPKDGHSI